MKENTTDRFNLNLTDDEFVALHAEASANGLHVNDFIVATLRKHTQIAMEIKAGQREAAAISEEAASIPSPS